LVLAAEELVKREVVLLAVSGTIGCCLAPAAFVVGGRATDCAFV